MLSLDITGQFKRDFKREKAGQHSNLDGVLNEVIEILVNKERLPVAKHDHPLKGAWKGFRDCHIKPDLVLIYRRTETSIELVRLGSHSELFD